MQFHFPILLLALKVTFSIASLFQASMHKYGYFRQAHLTDNYEFLRSVYLTGVDDYDYSDTVADIIAASNQAKAKPPPWTHSCGALRKDWLWAGLTKGKPYEQQDLRIALFYEELLEHAAAALLRATLLAAGYKPENIHLYHRDYKNPPVLNNTLKRNSEHAVIYILNEWEHTCVAEIMKQFVAKKKKWFDVVYLERNHLRSFVHEFDRSFFFLDADHWSDSPYVRIVQLTKNVISKSHCKLTPEKIVLLKGNDDYSPALSETFTVFSPNLNDLRNVTEIAAENHNNMAEAACKWAQQQHEQFSVWQKAAVVKPTLRTVAVIVCKTEVQDFKEYVYLTELIESSKTIFTSKLNDKPQIKIQVFYVDCLDTDWLLRKLLNWFSKNIVSKTAGVVLTENLATAAAPLANKFQLPLLTYDVRSPESVARSATGRLEHLELAIRRLLADCDWRRLAIVSEPTRLAVSLSAALSATTTGLAVHEVNVTSKETIQSALRELRAADARVFLVNAGADRAAAILAAAHELNISWHNGFTWIVREYKAADNATAATRPFSVSFWWRGNVESEISQYNNTQDVEVDEIIAKAQEAVQRSGLIETNFGNDGHYNQEDDDDDYEDDYDTRYTDETEEELCKTMEKRWRGRAWPLYAAPLLDALLTMGEGLQRMSSFENTWLNARRDGTLRDFWNIVQQKNISSIHEDLSYDDDGVLAPLVYVEQWGEEPRPRLLATWRSDDWRNLAETCPMTGSREDGSTHCIVPAGNPFQPTCKDGVWVSSISFALIMIVAAIVAVIRRSLQALTARDNRIKTDFASRLLARRERVFAALAPHLVDRSALELYQELGNGRFGHVHLGVLRDSRRKRQTVIVAAKALREDAAPAEESEFLREACMLASLDHVHVVHFVGVCVIDGSMKHAFFGDLLRYLQTRRYLADATMTSAGPVANGIGFEEKAYVSAKALTRLAYEAASALAYIAQRGIVHRDLRASNCLVDERRTLKLADFGLARETGAIDGEYACRRGFFPVLWMAPESLETGVCSAASDVWAFGVLVFELVTLGRRPYGSQPPPSVLRYVLAGGRPQLPWDASAETRALVRACWRRAPEARPKAAQLADWLNTRWRALRPALVTELVDVDSHIYGNTELNDLEFDAPNNDSPLTPAVATVRY